MFGAAPKRPAPLLVGKSNVKTKTLEDQFQVSSVRYSRLDFLPSLVALIFLGTILERQHPSAVVPAQTQQAASGAQGEILLVQDNIALPVLTLQAKPGRAQLADHRGGFLQTDFD